MTPGTPVEHRGLDNTMAALQLPPAQLQSTPVFQFSAGKPVCKPRNARRLFKTHAIAGPSKETVQTTVTETDTQTMTVDTRTMWTQHWRCGCLQCTSCISNKCKWQHIIKTAQLIDHAVVRQQQNFAITLLLIAATEWHVGGSVYNMYEEKRLKRRDRRVRKNSKGHQTPKVWKGTVRNASSQVGTETTNMETQTEGKEKPKKQSHTAVQTCDMKRKGFFRKLRRFWTKFCHLLCLCSRLRQEPDSMILCQGAISMRLGHSVKLRKQIMRRISELQVKNNIESGQTPTESRRKRGVVTGHIVEHGRSGAGRLPGRVEPPRLLRFALRTRGT